MHQVGWNPTLRAHPQPAVLQHCTQGALPQVWGAEGARHCCLAELKWTGAVCSRVNGLSGCRMVCLPLTRVQPAHMWLPGSTLWLAGQGCMRLHSRPACPLLTLQAAAPAIMPAHAAGRATGAIIAGSCWTGGLATLVEKKSRRMELAIYCLSRAIESFALCLASWGWVKSNRFVAAPGAWTCSTCLHLPGGNVHPK